MNSKARDTSEYEPIALIFDKNRTILNLTGEWLKARGYRVIKSDSFQEAVNTSKTALYDIAFVGIEFDWEKAGDLSESGLAIAKIIRDRHVNIPIIGYSSYLEEGLLPDSEFNVLTEYYFKGMDSEHWTERIDKYRAIATDWHKNNISSVDHIEFQELKDEDIIEIKPNFFGLGVNFNALLRKVKSIWQQKEKSKIQ